MKRKNKVGLVYFLTLAGILLWLGLIFLAPYLKSQDSGLNVFAYLIFAPIKYLLDPFSCSDTLLPCAAAVWASILDF
jgi:hypothetical protein